MFLIFVSREDIDAFQIQVAQRELGYFPLQKMNKLVQHHYLLVLTHLEDVASV